MCRTNATGHIKDVVPAVYDDAFTWNHMGIHRWVYYKDVYKHTIVWKHMEFYGHNRRMCSYGMSDVPDHRSVLGIFWILRNGHVHERTDCQYDQDGVYGVCGYRIEQYIHDCRDVQQYGVHGSYSTRCGKDIVCRVHMPTGTAMVFDVRMWIHAVYECSSIRKHLGFNRHEWSLSPTHMFKLGLHHPREENRNELVYFTYKLYWTYIRKRMGSDIRYIIIHVPASPYRFRATSNILYISMGIFSSQRCHVNIRKFGIYDIGCSGRRHEYHEYRNSFTGTPNWIYSYSTPGTRDVNRPILLYLSTVYTRRHIHLRLHG